MPFRDNQTHLHDILEGIDHIESFVGDITFDAYRSDLKTKSAVERQLQVITEAAKRLGDAAEELCPPIGKGFAAWGTSSGMDITRWMMRSSGTVKDELQPMRAAIMKLLGSGGSTQNDSGGSVC